MIKPEFKNWWTLHNYLLEQKNQLQKSGGSCDKIDCILFSSCTVKIRIEYSHYFASEVLHLRMDDEAGDECRRDFEAWLFFIRSAIDCLAHFINDICNLGISDKDVSALSLMPVIAENQDLKDLYSLLCSNIDNSEGAWFWHLNQLRNQVTHRSVVRLVQFAYIGSTAPERDDLHFTLEDPRDLGSFVNKPELGVGQYAEDKFDKVYTLVEETYGLFDFNISKGNIKLVL